MYTEHLYMGEVLRKLEADAIIEVFGALTDLGKSCVKVHVHKTCWPFAQARVRASCPSN